jgi:hypothetical protein
MKTRSSAKPSDRAALAALYGCYKRHGHEGFKINRGPDRAALIVAIERGWLYGFNDHVRITADGIEALQPYLEGVPA